MADLVYIFKQDLLEVIDGQTLAELTGGRAAMAGLEAQDGSDRDWRRSSIPAIDEVRGYAARWYDMDKELRPFCTFNNTVAIAEGTRIATPEVVAFDNSGVTLLGAWVESGDTVYECIQEAPANTVITDTGFFAVRLRPMDSQIGQRIYYLAIADAPIGAEIDDSTYFDVQDDRNPTILHCVAILTAYYLHRRKNARTVPEQMRDDYDICIDRLKQIQKGNINLNIAEPEEPESNDPGQRIIWGTFGTRQNY